MLPVVFMITFLHTDHTTAQPSGNESVDGELIFELQTDHVHGSSVLPLENGDVLATWFQGSGERTADNVKIMGARRTSGGWSEPFEMADTDGIPDCNPVLFFNQDGKLFLSWIAVLGNRWEGSVIRYKTSVDYLNPGAPLWNWQDNILLKPDDDFATEVEKKMNQLPSLGRGWAEYAPAYEDMIIEASTDPVKRSIGWMTRIQPLVLDNGRILLPLYSDGYNLSIMAVSDDKGSTWKPGLPLVGRGPIQPALIQKSNGDIVAYLRDSGDAPGRVQISTSSDSGESWSPARKTTLSNTASVDVLKLDDGRWLFVGNDISDGRYQLSLLVSDDEGATWETAMLLEKVNKGDGGFSYPCLHLGDDGMIHLTYSYHLSGDQKSIKYVQLDPSTL